MIKKSTPIRELMNRLPIEVQATDPVAAAVDAMADHRIRHVPVLSGSHLIGIVSKQDLDRVRIREGRAAMKRAVGDVCTRDVLTVAPTEPVSHVAQKMLERSVGSALVVDGDVLVGIFTRTDALRALAGA